MVKGSRPHEQETILFADIWYLLLGKMRAPQTMKCDKIIQNRKSILEKGVELLLEKEKIEGPELKALCTGTTPDVQLAKKENYEEGQAHSCRIENAGSCR